MRDKSKTPPSRRGDPAPKVPSGYTVISNRKMIAEWDLVTCGSRHPASECSLGGRGRWLRAGEVYARYTGRELCLIVARKSTRSAGERRAK